MGEQKMKERLKLMDWPAGFGPVQQASVWIPQRIYKWQKDVLGDIMYEGARVALKTNNESGKTSILLPIIGLSFMAAFPGAQVVSTAGVERQIKKNLWPILTSIVSEHPKWGITQDDLTITAPSVRGLPPSTWTAFTARDPDYAQGFHGQTFRDKNKKLVRCPLMMIIDEAFTFTDNGMFDAFKRCDPDIWLVASTPGAKTGPFYDCFNSGRDNPWKCHEVNWTMCPHLQTGFKLETREREIKEKGVEDPLVKSMILGEFFGTGGRIVFDRWDDVEHSMSGLVPSFRGERSVALDFSGGGDEQVFAVRDGNSVLEMLAFHIRDATQLGDKFIDLFRKWNVMPENIIADNGGLGKPCIDYLEQKGWVGIYRYMAQMVPRDKTRFVNRFAEDHFELKYLMEQKAISLPNDNKLKDQMQRRKYLMKNDDSNKVRLEPKTSMRNRGEDSPDRLDTIVMLFSNMPPIDAGSIMTRSKNRGGLRCGLVKDCFIKDEDGEESIFGHSRFEE